MRDRLSYQKRTTRCFCAPTPLIGETTLNLASCPILSIASGTPNLGVLLTSGVYARNRMGT